MTIKIYKPAKTAMQSGKRKTKKWLAEYISNSDNVKDFLMGWNSSLDTKSQAVKWARKNNFQYYVVETKIKKIKPKSYSENFDYNRKEPWTH